MKMHPSITQERILEAARLSMFDSCYIGFCIACGEEATGVEPDICNYRCIKCKQNKVFGAESILPYIA